MYVIWVVNRRVYNYLIILLIIDNDFVIWRYVSFILIVFFSEIERYGDFLGYEIYEFSCKLKDVNYGFVLVYSMWVKLFFWC